jgi:predicted Zn-dependent protease
VVYLNGTNYYACNGAAGFFEKLLAANGGAGTPEFLSTHPDPGNRVEAINTKAASLNCTGRTPANTNFAALQNALR